MTESTTLGLALITWFDNNRRDLPWRRERTPYGVWISEIMLQQTRVDTVIPYYERFLKAFPTVAHLAAASETDVLKLWEGLGYYSRARNLRRAAREVIARYGGEMPSDPDELRTLPGIGPYTSGAIASIAYNVPVPAVDGNVLRVIARLDGIDDVITTAAAKRQVEARVRAMIPPGRAAGMTEALMELGALLCLPRTPACEHCPWQNSCVARRDDVVDELPRRRARTQPRIVHGAVAVVSAPAADGGMRVLVRRRPPDGLLAGLWEFPWLEVDPDSSDAARQDALVRAFAHQDVEFRVGGRLPSVRHVFSHLEWHLDVFVGEAVQVESPRDEEPNELAPSPIAGDSRWITRDTVDALPFGRAHRRIADAWLRSLNDDADNDEPPGAVAKGPDPSEVGSYRG